MLACLHGNEKSTKMVFPTMFCFQQLALHLRAHNSVSYRKRSLFFNPASDFPIILHLQTFSWAYTEPIGQPVSVNRMHEQFKIRGDCILQASLATNLHNYQVWWWRAWLFRWTSELLLYIAMGFHGYFPNCNHNLLIDTTPSIKSAFEAIQWNGKCTAQ